MLAIILVFKFKRCQRGIQRGFFPSNGSAHSPSRVPRGFWRQIVPLDTMALAMGSGQPTTMKRMSLKDIRIGGAQHYLPNHQQR